MEFLKRELLPRKFFAADGRLPGLTGPLRGFRGLKIGKRIADLRPRHPNPQGTSGRPAPLVWCRRIRKHPMEHFDVRKIAKRRQRAHEPLTTRERQIVLVLSEGVTNKEIGRRLKLAEGT